MHAVFSTKIFHDFGQGVSNIVADSIGTKRINIKGMGLPGWTGAIISFTGAAAGAYSENSTKPLDINKFSIDTTVNLGEGVVSGAAATITFSRAAGLFAGGEMLNPAGGGFIAIIGVLGISGLYSVVLDNYVGKQVKESINNGLHALRETSTTYNQAIIKTADLYEFTEKKLIFFGW